MGRSRHPNLKKRYAREKFLFGGFEEDPEDHPRRVYDPDYHPDDIVEYFREAYAKVADPTYFVSEHRAQYIAKPVRPPTQAAWAAKHGIARETVWAWGQKYPEFGDALDVAKAYQEALLVELGAIGALNPAVTNFILKNLQGWAEKVEETHKGNVALVIDDQDAEA